MTNFQSWLRQGTQKKDWSAWDAAHPPSRHPGTATVPATGDGHGAGEPEGDHPHEAPPARVPAPSEDDHTQDTKPTPVAPAPVVSQAGTPSVVRTMGKARVKRAIAHKKPAVHVASVPKVHVPKGKKPKVVRLHHARVKKPKVHHIKKPKIHHAHIKKPKVHHAHVKKPKVHHVRVKKPRVHRASATHHARTRRRKKAVQGVESMLY